MKLVVKSLVLELLGLDVGLRRPILGLSEGVFLDMEESEACSKKFSNGMAWLGRGSPEADLRASGRGPPGSGRCNGSAILQVQGPHEHHCRFLLRAIAQREILYFGKVQNPQRAEVCPEPQ